MGIVKIGVRQSIPANRVNQPQQNLPPGSQHKAIPIPPATGLTGSAVTGPSGEGIQMRPQQPQVRVNPNTASGQPVQQGQTGTAIVPTNIQACFTGTMTPDQEQHLNAMLAELTQPIFLNLQRLGDPVSKQRDQEIEVTKRLIERAFEGCLSGHDQLSQQIREKWGDIVNIDRQRRVVRQELDHVSTVYHALTRCEPHIHALVSQLVKVSTLSKARFGAINPGRNDGGPSGGQGSSNVLGDWLRRFPLYAFRKTAIPKVRWQKGLAVGQRHLWYLSIVGVRKNNVSLQSQHSI